MTKIFGQQADMVADIDTLLARLTALRADYLDELAAGNIPTDLTTINDLVDDLETRITAIRADYLDQLDFNLQEAIATIPTTAMRGTDSALLAANYVTERGTDNAALASLAGNYISGKAVTAVLAVSPNGDGSSGLSWSTAFTTIPGALDAASTDTDDLTLILVSPHTTYYDINTTGDPTWAANVMLVGTHPHFTMIKNDHGSATAILKLTGKSEVKNLLFDLGTGNNGLIMTKTGVTCDHIHINGSSLTSAKTGIWLDGASAEHADLYLIDIVGNVTYLTGLKIDQFARCHIDDLAINKCLAALQIVGADSDENLFRRLDIGDSALGIDIDAGNAQHFEQIIFQNNVKNVEDEVGDSIWTNIFGRLDIDIEPDDLVGIQVNTGAANTYGSDTELRAAGTSTVPFRVVGINMKPSTSNEWYQIRLSDDSGSTFFDVIQFYGNKREGMAAPSGTEHIFNKGTRISASVRDVSGGDNVKVWLEIQEI